MSAYQKFFALILTLVLIGLAVVSMGSTAGAKTEDTSAEVILTDWAVDGFVLISPMKQSSILHPHQSKADSLLPSSFPGIVVHLAYH